MNTATLLTQRSGKLMASNKSIKMILFLQRLTLCYLNMYSTSPQSLKTHHSDKDKYYGGGLSTKSDVNFHKCEKKGHIQRCCKSNVNGPNGGTSKNPIRYPRFRRGRSGNIHNEPKQQQVKKWCISCHSCHGTWVSHWKDIHKGCK